MESHSNANGKTTASDAVKLARKGQPPYTDAGRAGKMCFEAPNFGTADGDAPAIPNGRVLRAILVLIVLTMLAAPRVFAQGDGAESDVLQIPFEALIAGNDTAQIPWEIVAGGWGLTADQRLRATVQVRIPARQVAARLGSGKFIFMVQLTDAQGHPYQSQDIYDLSAQKLPPDTDYLSVIFNAFAAPGDYKLAVAVYDSASKEYSVAHRDLHVAAIKNDPLPESTSESPAVEFWPVHAPLETLAEGVKLEMRSQRPIRVEILLNATFTEAVNPSKKVYEQSLVSLVPEFETLSQMSLTDGEVDATALDLTQQKVVFEQDDVKILDWRRLNDSLTQIDPGVISASSLEGQPKEAQYFTSQVMRRISGDGTEATDRAGANPLRVVVVLSGPMTFPSGESLQPISLSRDCDCRVYYIRAHTLEPAASASPGDDRERDRDRDRDPVVPQGYAFTPDLLEPEGPAPPTPPSDACPQNNCNYDELENMLAPLHPRAFDVYSPLEFRKALAAILNDVGHL